MRRRLDAEIALCCEELESLHCLGGAMLDPLLQLAKDSDLGWARGSIVRVLTDMNSVDYGDDAAVSKRAKGVIEQFMRLLAVWAPRALKPVLDAVKPKIEAYVKNRGSTSADLVALLNDVGSILVTVRNAKYAKLSELGEILAALRLPAAQVLKPAPQPQPP